VANQQRRDSSRGFGDAGDIYDGIQAHRDLPRILGMTDAQRENVIVHSPGKNCGAVNNPVVNIGL
jgi:hypothetical protein